MTDHQAIMTSPIGRIGLRLDATDRLVALDFLGDRGRSRPPVTMAGRRIVAALLGYFADPMLPFDIPLVPAGTPYQQRVWAALRQIPPGSTWTYGELARRLNSAPRAVGQACRRNPIPIIIPCHRVVARDGAGGYSGAVSGPELGIKRWLLAHEGAALGT